MIKPYRILVVCTGNICRSPMAEGMLKQYLPADLRKAVEVRSAGTHAHSGLPAEPNAVQAMKELSVDISGHRSCLVDAEMAGAADSILVMERSHEVFLRHLIPERPNSVHLLGNFGGELTSGEIDDPYGSKLEVYRPNRLSAAAGRKTPC